MTRTHRRFRGWVTARRARRGRPAATVSPTAGHCASLTPTIRVEHVDDPELPFRLVRADGMLCPATIDRLLDAWSNLVGPCALHLDLGDALIADAVTMQCLETALDHLERQRIEVRLVGIDPQHPVLHR
ncbi:MAG: hypothetical protein R8G01_04455 [Ilumatobacteraceae bacterium]|nr:hypothetical protein [Ilumatobacteraceae bacterium]